MECKFPIIQIHRTLKSAHTGRFFILQTRIFLVFFSSLIFNTTAIAYEPLCGTSSFDQSVEIDYVIDGDTVITKSGIKIRLIGVDTPEMGRGQQVDEPGARRARSFLNDLFRHKSRVKLVFDEELQDSHNRTLAHLFTDSTNVQEKLLSRGLATPLTIPPNLKFTRCYQHASQTAYENREGLWEQARYRPSPVETLNRSQTGYALVHGRITRIGHSKSSLWLSMGDFFVVRILRPDLVYFKPIDPGQLLNLHIQVRGKIYRRNSQSRIRIRHPSDLEIMVHSNKTPGQ